MNLSQKTFYLLYLTNKLFPEAQGIVKCDDDVLPNIQHLLSFFLHLKENVSIDYCGNAIKVAPHYSKYMQYKNVDQQAYYIPETRYCYGPCYYLSLRAIRTLARKSEQEYNVFEDVMVGINVPFSAKNWDLFDNSIQQFPFISIHNHARRPLCFVDLHDSSFSHHLFQCATAYAFAKRTMRVPICVVKEVFDRRQFSENVLFVSVEATKGMELWMYEVRKRQRQVENGIASSLSEKHILLRGNFLYYSMIHEFRHEIATFLMRPCKVSSEMRRDVYFLQTFKGSGAPGSSREDEATLYLRNAVNFIVKKELSSSLSPTFVVFREDLPFLTNAVFIESLRSLCDTFIVHDEPVTEVELISLYSRCEKGGICSNLLTGWWGAYLNANAKKTVIMPSVFTKVHSPEIIYPGVIIL